MKISESTFEVLKNFSTINPSLSFKTGNVLRTVSPQKNILASAVVSESFPQDFAIYEMNQFLGLTSLFEDAVFDFGSSSLTVSEASQPSSQCRYTYTDPSMITSPPEKNLELPDPEVQFDMTAATIRKLSTLRINCHCLKLLFVVRTALSLWLLLIQRIQLLMSLVCRLVTLKLSLSSSSRPRI